MLLQPPKGAGLLGVSENAADGPFTYQREQKVIPHPGSVQGWAHQSRVWLHDLGHVPCHLSAVWGCHQPYQVLRDRKALCQSPGWSDTGLGLACWGFTSHSAGGWSKMHFCLIQFQDELYRPSPRQGWGSISISWGEWCCWRLSGGGSPAKPLASAAQAAEHVPPHRPLC